MTSDLVMYTYTQSTDFVEAILEDRLEVKRELTTCGRGPFGDAIEILKGFLGGSWPVWAAHERNDDSCCGIYPWGYSWLIVWRIPAADLNEIFASDVKSWECIVRAKEVDASTLEEVFVKPEDFDYNSSFDKHIQYVLPKPKASWVSDLIDLKKEKDAWLNSW